MNPEKYSTFGKILHINSEEKNSKNKKILWKTRLLLAVLMVLMDGILVVSPSPPAPVHRPVY